jgi:hypothetical protein
MNAPIGIGKFARQQIAQHVGDGDAALEGGDLDASAERRRDVDSESGGVEVCGDAGWRGWIGTPDPALGVTRPRRETAAAVARGHGASLLDFGR